MTIWRMRVSCWISQATLAQVHARDRASAPTSTTTYARTRKHSATCTHTYIYVTLISFARQQWFREWVSLLCYTYITSFVIFDVVCCWTGTTSHVFESTRPVTRHRSRILMVPSELFVFNYELAGDAGRGAIVLLFVCVPN